MEGSSRAEAERPPAASAGRGLLERELPPDGLGLAAEAVSHVTTMVNTSRFARFALGRYGRGGSLRPGVQRAPSRASAAAPRVAGSATRLAGRPGAEVLEFFQTGQHGRACGES